MISSSNDANYRDGFAAPSALLYDVRQATLRSMQSFSKALSSDFRHFTRLELPDTAAIVSWYTFS